MVKSDTCVLLCVRLALLCKRIVYTTCFALSIIHPSSISSKRMPLPFFGLTEEGLLPEDPMSWKEGWVAPLALWDAVQYAIDDIALVDAADVQMRLGESDDL